MKIVFVHLSGSKRGSTEVFTEARLNVGTDPGNELCFDPSIDRHAAPFHAEIGEQKDGKYLLRSRAAGISVNNQRVEEAMLHDGDMIEFGEGGPKVCFRAKSEEGPVGKPFREMLEDSVAMAREEHRGGLITTGSFLRELLWEAFTQSSLRFRMALGFGVLVALVLWSIIFYSSLSQRKLEKEVTHRLEKTAERIETLEARDAVAEMIIRNFSGGVCLIQGVYGFQTDKTVGPLNVPYEYTGSGFLIGVDGKILTNKHIAIPWWRRPGRYGPVEMGFTPEFKEFRAFFPGIEKSFPIKVERVSERMDLAIVSIDHGDKKLPILELDTNRDIVVGEPVVVIGYPAGISAILARVEKSVMDELVYTMGLDFLELADELSRRHLVRPLATQGHITGVLEDRVVFDAQTTIGGSGGPIIDRNGKVIAITYGIFTGFTGSNLAIPAKHVAELFETPAQTETKEQPETKEQTEVNTKAELERQTKITGR
ncbi:MAG: trypsin-like peptidase domain-containing protein [Candidatus Brocadiales bacterium]